MNPTPGARRALAVLTLINLFNYLDRFVVSALVESLKQSELALTDTQLGLLMPSFIVVYMIASPIFGELGDRKARPRLIAFGVVLWSLATAASGLAWGFVSLLITRAIVGIGEAAYGTIAPALISDFFPRSRRGRALAAFFMAIPVGSALGFVLGGLIDARWGWRAAFFVAGLPGLGLAALILRTPDPERGATEAPDLTTERDPEPDTASVEDRRSFWLDYRTLFRNRAFMASAVGYGAYTFAVGGLAFWMPAFLERVRGLSREEATVNFGAVVVVTGFLGTYLGGRFGDALLRRTQNAYLWVSGLSTLAAVPFAWITLTAASTPVFMSALVVSQLLLFVSTGPINSAIVNAVPARRRATALGLSILIMHLLGDIPSPAIIGALSDASSLAEAVLIVPVATLVSGLIWTGAAWWTREATHPPPKNA